MEECFVAGQARECKYTAVDEVTTWLRIGTAQNLVFFVMVFLCF